MSRRALILSSSFDRANFQVVAERLRASGYQVLELLTDEVSSGRQKLRVELTNGAFVWSIDDGPAFDPAEIDAAWWRKPQWSNVARRDPAQRLSLELELERMHLTLGSLIPESAWLNSPAAMRGAESKLRQLELASEIGLNCPDTMITNSWDALRQTFGSGEVIFKALRGQVRIDGEDRIVFTQQISLHAFSNTPEVLPYPGLIQTRIEGAKEWRVTIVDDQVFPVAVYIPRGTIDWRKEQLRGQARFVLAELDLGIQEALVKLVGQLGLRYAAIDLMETPSGEYVFLEANANGQYSWLETELRLPISDAIASALIAGREG